jgi:hypothetical protein
VNSKRPLAASVESSVREPLHIRLAASSADWEIAHQMLDEEHFLGAGRGGGDDRFCQFVIEEGKVVAVLIWCAAARHLNDRPKKLWLKPLDPDAFQRMCAKDLPDDCQQAVVVSGGARSPLKLEEINSLRSAFLQVPDPHAYVAALTDWLQAHSGIFPRSLALTRNALLAVIPFDEKRNLLSLIDHYQQNPQIAIDLLFQTPPQIWTFQPNALRHALRP